MNRTVARRWLGIVGAVLAAAGCRSGGETSNGPPLYPTTTLSSSAYYPGPKPPFTPTPVTPQWAPAPLPVVVKPVPVPAVQPAANTAPPPVAPVVPAAKNEAPGRRTFVDITARPGFGRAEDHSWLQGELGYDRIRGQWRLRYASVDEEDAFGGSVMLEGAGSLLSAFKPGDLVRVEGEPARADSHSACPPYRVRSLEAVSH